MTEVVVMNNWFYKYLLRDICKDVFKKKNICFVVSF